MASVQPVRLTRDILLMKLFLALAIERHVVRQLVHYTEPSQEDIQRLAHQVVTVSELATKLGLPAFNGTEDDLPIIQAGLGHRSRRVRIRRRATELAGTGNPRDGRDCVSPRRDLLFW